MLDQSMPTEKAKSNSSRGMPRAKIPERLSSQVPGSALFRICLFELAYFGKKFEAWSDHFHTGPTIIFFLPILISSS